MVTLTDEMYDDFRIALTTALLPFEKKLAKDLTEARFDIGKKLDRMNKDGFYTAFCAMYTCLVNLYENDKIPDEAIPGVFLCIELFDELIATLK